MTEAKAFDKPLTEGVAQAKDYAAKLAVRFAYATNGQGIYVSVGLEELDQDELTPLLRLKYHDSIADAMADLGRPDEIGRAFAGFQKYLYQHQAVA